MPNNHLLEQAFQVVNSPNFDIEDYIDQFHDYHRAILSLYSNFELDWLLVVWLEKEVKSPVSWVLATWLLEFEYSRLAISAYFDKL